MIYRCRDCADKLVATPKFPPAMKTEVSSTQASLDNLRQQIDSVGQKMGTLQSEMAAKLDSVGSVTGLISVKTAADISSKEKPSTFASAVTSNLSSIVKSTVASTFKEQRREDRDKATIVKYGLVEDMNDVIDAKEILLAIGCDLQVLSFVRLGHLKPASDSKLS